MANQVVTDWVLANHRATSKYLFGIQSELYKDPKDNEREVYNQISPVLAEGQTILK